MKTINAIDIIPKKTDYCPTMGDYAIAKKMNIPWGKHKRGDIVLFDFNRNGTSDHIGILEKINKDGSLVTIEGNTGSGNDTNGGQVQRRTRYKSQVNYFVRPKYNKEVTADMLINTAIAELGTKESPKNSNKVKYNVWFYGSNKSAFWCCTFVCWLFAHVRTKNDSTIEQPDEEILNKPTGKYDGIIPDGGLKKGSKGDNVKNLQKFLNWYLSGKLNVDGSFGNNTEKAVKKFQRIEGLTVDGNYGKKSAERAKTYKAKDPEPEKKGYDGKFPEPNDNRKIANGLAWRFCYPYGTKESVYKYDGGKPRDAYAKGIDEAFPDHMKWSNKKQKVGACCDMLPGTILRLIGIPSPRHLKDQVKELPEMTDKLKDNGHHKANDFVLGDLVQRFKSTGHGHTWIVCELINGEKYVANAHYRKLNGAYAVMDAKPSNVDPSKYASYHCFTILGAIRNNYKKGDYGYDVKYIQEFLNWYGIKCSIDGDFGNGTEKAVKQFQEKEDLKIDGVVGNKTINAMKNIKK